MRVKGDVTAEMGMEAYSQLHQCKHCFQQVILATTTSGRTFELDVRGTYKPKAGRPGGLWTCFYEVNPLTGKIVDGVQFCQPFDPEHDTAGWRVHIFTCPVSMAEIDEGKKIADCAKGGFKKEATKGR